MPAPKTKVCTKCGKRKKLGDFYADKQNKDGLRWHCKECVVAANRAYRHTPAGRENERRCHSRYYEANREACILAVTLNRDIRGRY